jgi:hypothetical protein
MLTKAVSAMPQFDNVMPSNAAPGPFARPVVKVISIEERKVAALEANTRAMAELATEMRLFRQERDDRIRRQFKAQAMGAAA